MFKLVAHLFSLEFTELKGGDKPAAIVWHKDVQVFRVQDDQERGGEFLGCLYMDLYH
jgi:metallopeptidase MepB